jgi:hypothetical protein
MAFYQEYKRHSRRIKMKVLAWHFCKVSEGEPILRNGEPAKRVGKTEHYLDEVVMCRFGLHASKNIMDALNDAPGCYLRRVECSGEMVMGDNKLVCSHRKILAEANMEQLLHEFACRCAERALEVTGIMDARCFAAINAKRAWLRGEINHEQLATARAAAWAAARNAAWDAACAAARNAAWDAAFYAARAAARAAALAAARAAALDAARAAARAAAAAWDAGLQWQAEELEKMFWKIANKEN